MSQTIERIWKPDLLSPDVLKKEEGIGKEGEGFTKDQFVPHQNWTTSTQTLLRTPSPPDSFCQPSRASHEIIHIPKRSKAGFKLVLYKLIYSFHSDVGTFR